MKRLTLTFDNGPFENGGTFHVLETLASRGIKATFFLVGKQLNAATRAIAEKTKAAGHWIGNHTLNHDMPLGRQDTPAQHHLREIGEMDLLLGNLRETVPLFRPYAGKGILGPHVLTTGALRYLEEAGHTVVLWNSVPRDWEQPPGAWVDRALQDIERLDWTTMVLHDRPNAAMQELPRFLDEVARRGVEVVQEFSLDCTPLCAGKRMWDLSLLVRTDT